MSWDDIRYFAVMRGGSLSAAARRCRFSTRRSRGASTRWSRARHPAVRPAAARMAADRRRAAPCRARGTHRNRRACVRARRPGAAALDGVVRVSASPVFASHFLAPRLARAQRAAGAADRPAGRDARGEPVRTRSRSRGAAVAADRAGPPRAGSARCASRCARRRNGRTRRPTPGRSSATTTRSRKRRSTSGSPASLPGAVSRSSPTTRRAASRVRGRRRRRAAAAVSRRRAGRACRRAARRADGRTALRHRARDLARGPPGRAPVAARAACRRRDRRSRSRGGRTAVGSCLRTRLCHARQRPA